MKFTILNKHFIKSLKKVNHLVTRNHTYPILENILLKIDNNILSLTSTNTEIEIKVTISKISSLQTGNTTTSGKKILEICQALSHEQNLKIEYVNDKLQILSHSNQYLLATLPSNNFPNLEISENQVVFSISQRSLRNILHATHFSMAIQDVRYFLNGLLFEVKNQHLYVVATDGYRIAICKTPLQYPKDIQLQPIILPRKSVLELIKLLNDSDEITSIKISKSYFQIHIQNLVFTSKIIIEKFPDYKSIILTQPTKTMILETILFKKALSRVAILSNEKFRGVNIENNNNILKITTHNQYDEKAFETLNIIFTNMNIKVSVNAYYIIDILNVIKENKIYLLTNNTTCSIQIQTCNHNAIPKAIYIIMPLQT